MRKLASLFACLALYISTVLSAQSIAPSIPGTLQGTFVLESAKQNPSGTIMMYGTMNLSFRAEIDLKNVVLDIEHVMGVKTLHVGTITDELVKAGDYRFLSAETQSAYSGPSWMDANIYRVHVSVYGESGEPLRFRIDRSIPLDVSKEAVVEKLHENALLEALSNPYKVCNDPCA